MRESVREYADRTASLPARRYRIATRRSPDFGDCSPMPTTQRVDTETEPLALLNRELSALDLMTRVLEVAADRNEPLLERVRFCGIVSSILDEFFMVRVAGLHDQ